MQSYTVYAESGGAGKTTLASNLAVAHSRAGLDVLLVPLDGQDADMSHLFDTFEEHSDREDVEVDTLLHHMVDRPQGDFYDLIKETGEGPDIIPEHDRYTSLEKSLWKTQAKIEYDGRKWPARTRLRYVLEKNNVHENYDMLICDPKGSAGVTVWNAIHATRNVLIPLKPTNKGLTALAGLKDHIDYLEEELEIGVGTVGIIPYIVDPSVASHEETLEAAVEDYGAPLWFNKRESLADEAWGAQCSLFTAASDVRDRVYDHEIKTLKKMDILARYIEEGLGVEAPDPPQPGLVDGLSDRVEDIDVEVPAYE